MADNENGAAAAPPDAANGMPKTDVDFLIECLKNTTGGPISIDSNKVAESLGYKNPRSVSNRIAALKKKYDFPFGSTSRAGDAATTPSRKASNAAGPNEPGIPTTPSKQRVTKTTKTRATSATKKKVTPKKGKKEKEEEEEEDTAEAGIKGEAEGDEDGYETFAVQDPTRLTDEELFFGTSGKKEQSDDEDQDAEA